MANGTSGTRNGGAANNAAPTLQATATANNAAPTTQKKQPLLSEGEGDSYVLGSTPESNLKAGNTYTFALQLLKAHPDFCKAQGFDDKAAQNKYDAFIDFNDGIFTFYGEGLWAGKKVPMKYFYDTKMKLVGTKI